MRRRDFVVLLGSAVAAWPTTVTAQRTALIRRISVLMGTSENDKDGQSYIKALRRGLGEFGWIENNTIHLDLGWTDGDTDKARILAIEYAKLQPDLIFCHAGLYAVVQQTRTIPILFVLLSDPVGSGFVASLARPRANITGFTNFDFAMASKWLNLLKEISPHIERIALLYNPELSSGLFYFRAVQAAASSLAIKPIAVPVRNEVEIEQTFVGLARETNAGLVVLSDAFVRTHSKLIISLAERHRLPAIYPDKHFVGNGGLISYGIDEYDIFRRSASYVDKILKGIRPSDLPVQASTKFELAINVKTAKTLGLAIPQSLLTTADEAIE